MNKILITLTILISIVIIGEMDYTNHVVEFKAYCDGVKEGVHPDYKESFDECEL